MLSKVIKQLKENKKIVFFTGAGISTESNIPDFRSSNGLYSKKEFNGFSPEQLLSYSCFRETPQIFYNYYFSNMIHTDKLPNIAHTSITNLEEKGHKVTVVTQNIDGLHQKGGNKNVIELHGSVYRNYCLNCGHKYNIKTVIDKKPIPHCDYCNGLIRPDVTLYEELLDDKVVKKAIDVINDADMLFVIGTSLVVQPAASLINYYKGEQLVLINKSKTSFDSKATYRFYDSCGKIMSEIIKGLEKNCG